MRRKIEFHMLKNYPYSNLNRDEFGTPKTFTFGGHLHGRISSQSQKFAWRKFFEDFFEEEISDRTRALPLLVKEVLPDKDEEFQKLAVEAIKSLFRSDKNKKDEKDEKDEEENKEMMKQIVPLSLAEIAFFKEEFSSFTKEELEKDVVKKLQKDKKSRLQKDYEAFGAALDIALFGRMVTSNVIESTESATQVSHALSTYPTKIETDFFAAVDDEIKKGAAIIDEAEYDSACYYEYVCLDYDLLVENLNNDEERARKVVPMLIKTLAYANPLGKNTTTGTNVLPSAMLVEKKEVPYTLADAYVEDKSIPKNMVEESVKSLAEHCEKMHKKYGLDAKRYWFSVPDVHCECAEEVETFKELVDKTAALV